MEAPLGPTCIYEASRSETTVTLAVERLSFTHVRQLLREPRRMTIAGRSAACGRLGMRMLFVPLTDGRVLNVTAPCAIAERFATIAIARLTA